MSARRKGRKRKLSDSFNEDVTSQPKAKRRKLHNKRSTKTKDDKSHSEEPKHALNPFENTSIPTAFTHPPIPRRHSQSPYSQEQEESSDNESPSPLPNYVTSHNIPLSKYQTIRSQPSTPRHINPDKKPEPLSQSAKRHRKYTTNHTKTSPIRSILRYTKSRNAENAAISPHSTSKTQYRKNIPGFTSSQDSISVSPTLQTPKKRQISAGVSVPTSRNALVIPVRATPLRQPRLRRINTRIDHKEDIEITVDAFYKYKGYILLFVLIGFIVGCVVCISVFHENKSQLHARNPMIKTDRKYMNQCTCDTTTNTSSVLCNPCMDQYWSLKSQCAQCDEQSTKLLHENKELKKEIDRITRQKTQFERICDKYKRKIARLETSRSVNDEVCGEYKQRIDVLEHELGECNVEWGSCEQLGRQKDKLDEKRVEEIAKQKEKFSLCNQQLKKYKEKKRTENR